MNLDTDIIIVATQNKGKVKEFEHAFAALGKQVKSMFDYPELPEVVEDGVTFAENAMKKAKTVAMHLEYLCLPMIQVYVSMLWMVSQVYTLPGMRVNMLPMRRITENCCERSKS
ncbi:nucleoside 5-triphosphatase RdgB [Paenibacillus pini JCM 16418]|uniref:Nucleoside 5-triphosphatase RdgB n=1 Tax=Paenibacillus pini JCM 16418 TaxID=1236976 RepID=W7YGB7_9BACL|nr:nucleoside 5-triphosphatase RdgB [Paenibacillus pini JCM 16418]